MIQKMKPFCTIIDVALTRFIDMSDDKKQGVYDMAQQAYAANEAIIWYIG